ncbi:MAG: hypothetical protein COY69_02150 [Candidatus Magasanikbacteria bacterium CG_4_10_14_0_8_um_filter_32_14]|uniref:DUF6922 domain-containing protein n=1 Tax=Candidatus Magasanikbacteria bacterium CG_4_10_14_0_8_um_filter_32_14 TaxID=1974640 RepID=A0A2M7R9V1_9BACT|nr:MAG: hypothetical protein COY69_02150 [Candidatus Magasanikbacteria bacterium CG_4_10_14_0_8_um_filter_32_14]
MKLTRSFQPFFWDTDFKTIDLKENCDFVICRLSEKGGLREFRWLKKNFSMKQLKNVIKNSKNVSAKTKNFWKFLK